MKQEKYEIEAQISTFTNSDEEIATIESFCATIQEKLTTTTFENKRQIIDLLDVRGKLAIENGERIIYVQCIISPQRQSLVLTSPLRCTYQGTPITLTAKLVLG